jgi:hypothetical protein
VEDLTRGVFWSVFRCRTPIDITDSPQFSETGLLFPEEHSLLLMKHVEHHSNYYPCYPWKKCAVGSYPSHCVP